MTHSPLTNQIRISRQSGPRLGARIDTFLIHHQAGTNDDQVIAAMVSGSRQVSANYTISNEGRLTCVVDEDLRAWTSGSAHDGGKGAAWDRRSITVEIENESGAPDYRISEAAIATAGKLLNDLRSRYPIVNVLGHRDLWEKHRASYATFCPGPNTVARILAAAGGAPAPAPKPGRPGVPAPAFPLPAGSYFGPKSGPVQSVSGYYSHREDLRRFMARLQERGYTFPRSGIDGLYGDELAGNVLAFQRDKGLVPDRLIGEKTWRAAWEQPIT